MTFSQLLTERLVFLDGGTGTLLQARGMGAGDSPELWNLRRPDDLTEIHRSYYDAGADVVVANSFGANPLKLKAGCTVEETASAAVHNLRAARDGAGHGFAALDVGPTGRLLAPLGDLDFDDALAAFRTLIEAGVRAGADLISVETMTDLYEMKAAVLAARECCDLPVIASAAFDGNGRLLTGADPAALVSLLEGLGVTALGINCGVGPVQAADTARALLKLSSTPVLLKPNAGLPCTENGCTHYDIDAAQFAAAIAPLTAEGVRLVGGCCGTTPEHIAALRTACDGIVPPPVTQKDFLFVSSGTRALDLREAELSSVTPISVPDDPDDLLDEAFDRQDEEAPMLRLDFSSGDGLSPVQAVDTVQSVLSLPLWLEGADTALLLPALRRVNGKALVTVPRGDEALLALLRRFGGVAYDPETGICTDCKRV